MLCVGIIAGVGVLFLEQGVFRWLVPILRRYPGSSIWKSVHLMFFSQVKHIIDKTKNLHAVLLCVVCSCLYVFAEVLKATASVVFGMERDRNT